MRAFGSPELLNRASRLVLRLNAQPNWLDGGGSGTVIRGHKVVHSNPCRRPGGCAAPTCNPLLPAGKTIAGLRPQSPTPRAIKFSAVPRVRTGARRCPDPSGRARSRS